VLQKNTQIHKGAIQKNLDYDVSYRYQIITTHLPETQRHLGKKSLHAWYQKTPYVPQNV
jgi:hypothetical protein